MLSNIYEYLDKIYNKPYFLLIYRFFKLFINIFSRVYYLFSYKKKFSSSGVIISFTTFPARIKSVYLVIESLLRQTIMPERIVLYLSNEQFSGIESLPKKLRKLAKDDYVEIRFVDNDYKPHKKYFYALSEFESKDIVTVDDDIFYPENFLEGLINTHLNFKESVCCNLTHRIKVENGKICRYREWISNNSPVNEERYDLIPIGCAGVYYPSGCFDLKILLNSELFMSLCPKADDLWLKCNSLLSKRTVVESNQYRNFIFLDIIIRNNSRLCDSNVVEDQNDVQFSNIMNMFPEIADLIIKGDYRVK